MSASTVSGSSPISEERLTDLVRGLLTEGSSLDDDDYEFFPEEFVAYAADKMSEIKDSTPIGEMLGTLTGIQTIVQMLDAHPALDLPHFKDQMVRILGRLKQDGHDRFARDFQSSYEQALGESLFVADDFAEQGGASLDMLFDTEAVANLIKVWKDTSDFEQFEDAVFDLGYTVIDLAVARVAIGLEILNEDELPGNFGVLRQLISALEMSVEDDEGISVLKRDLDSAILKKAQDLEFAGRVSEAESLMGLLD